MKKILILGSEGVIGKSLTKLLRCLNDTREIICYDIVLNNDQDLRTCKIDTTDVEFIFFLAYDIGGSKYLENQQIEFINNNILIMYNVFNQIKNVPFIFASSQMQNMDCAYGTLKRLGEHYTNLLNGLSVRFWNVYGPEEIGIRSHVICDFINQYQTNGLIKMITNGKEQRQFLYTDDCSEALYITYKNYESIKQDQKSFVDITSFEWISIKEIATIITNCNNDVVIEGDKIDTIQTIKNEPDPYILQYWNGPKISISEGLSKIKEAQDNNQ